MLELAPLGRGRGLFGQRPRQLRRSIASRTAHALTGSRGHRLCQPRLGGWRCALVVAAASGPRRAGELTPEEMEHLLLRLRNDDVEHFELKALCKARGLGGKDSRENLRQKLLKNLEEELLGGSGSDSEEAAGGPAPAPAMPAPAAASAAGAAARLRWESLTLVKLREEAAQRGLLKKGSKAELVARLVEWEEQQQPAAVAGEAGEADGGAGQSDEEYQAPYPPPLHPQALLRAQQAYSAMKAATIPVLRELLRGRGQSSTGRREVLVERLTEALEREAVQAFGGRKQLAAYANEAVQALSEAEVFEELRARGMGTALSLNDAVATLEDAVMREWVEDALLEGLQKFPGGAGALQPAGGEDAAAAGLEGEAEQQWGEGEDAGLFAPARAGAEQAAAAAGYGYSGGEAGTKAGDGGAELYAEPAALASTLPADPPLTLGVLCCGATPAQRQAALASARLAVRLLQSDPCKGTLPAPQLEEGKDQPLSALAVHVYYWTPTGALCALSWERLHAGSAEELDAGLELAGEAVDPEAALSGADVLLPLGLPAPGLAPLLAAHASKVVGSTPAAAATSAEPAALAGDSVALADALRALGFPALRLLRLSLADFRPSEAGTEMEDSVAYLRVESWLRELGHEEPEMARVAVRAEVAGEVADASMVLGPSEVLQVALAQMAREGVESVVLEAEHPQGAVYMQCTVLGTPQGAVALPPTELGWYDLESEILETGLSFERFLAVHESMPPERVDAILDALRAASMTHPAYLGGPATPTQQLRASTPPQGLGAEASQAVRRAAVKAFQELGLRDYAQFSGWILPPSAAPASPAADAALALAAAAAELDGVPAEAVLAADAEAEQAQQNEQAEQQERPKGLSFAELNQPSPSAPGEGEGEELPYGLVPADQGRQQALEQGASGWEEGSRYGVFNGVEITEGTRLEWIGENINRDPSVKSIPEDDEVAVVEALEDLSALSPADACALPGSAGTLHWAALSITPAITSPSDLLFQQAAAAGATHRAVLRHLLGPAVERAGKEPLPQLEPVGPDLSIYDEPEDFIGSEWDPLADVRVDLGAVGAMVEEEADVLAMAAPLTPEQIAEAAQLELEPYDNAGSTLPLGLDQPLLPPAPGFGAGAEGADAGGLGAAGAEEGEELGPGEGESFFEVDAEEWNAMVYNAGGAEEDGEEVAAAGSAAAPGDAAALDQEGALGLGAFGQEAWGSSQQQQQAQQGQPYSSGDALNPAPGAGEGGWEAQGAAAAPGPARQKVWILFGGDGPQREASLESGLHAFLQLRDHPSLDVEAFLLEPSDCGPAEERRRRGLLKKRLDLLKLGADDAFFAEEGHSELLESHIRTPPPSSLTHDTAGIWRLSGSGVVRGTVAEMQSACEVTLASACVAPANLSDEQAAARAAQSVTQQELTLAGVNLDGSAWGGAAPGALEQPGPPGYSFIEQWAEEARAAGAVVMLALCSEPFALGPVQRILEANGVPLTGSGYVPTELCCDKVALMQQLAVPELESNGVSTAPLHKMSLPELLAQCETESAAQTLFLQLSGFLGAPGAALSIKPATTSCGRGVARIACGRDLVVYARAVSQWLPEIEEGGLSQQEGAVAMLLPPPTLFVIEPFITTELMQLIRGPGGAVVPPAAAQPFPSSAADPARAALEARLHWPAESNQWVEVVAHLVGEAGKMICLGPTVLVAEVRQGAPGPQALATLEQLQRRLAEREEEADLAELAELGVDVEAELESSSDEEPLPEQPAQPEVVRMFDMTPPPSTYVLPEAVQSFKVRMQYLADRLGICGVARVDAFMNSITGEVVVTEVDTLPSLAPDALIFKQAAAEGDPLPPSDLFLELVRLGMLNRVEYESDEEGGPAPGYDLDAGDSLLEGDDALLLGSDPDAPGGWQGSDDEGDWSLDYRPDFSAPQL